MITWQVKNNKLFAYVCNKCIKCEIENDHGICTVKQWSNNNKLYQMTVKIEELEPKLKEEGFIE